MRYLRRFWRALIRAGMVWVSDRCVSMAAAGGGAFSAAGSLAVILMWLFYSAAVFLYGVAFARVLQE